MEKLHSKYAPSKLSRVLACPGSAGAAETEEAGPAALKGTQLHDLAEEMLTWGEPISDPDPQDVRRVQPYVDYVLDWKSQLEPCTLGIEVMLRSSLVPEFFGTADAVLVSEDTLHIIDLKTGNTPVSPYDNTQLMAYLSLLWEQHPWKTKFFASIVQPSVGGSPVAVEYTASQLIDFRLRLIQALDSDELHAGNHCRYCPLLATCETARNHVLQCADFQKEDLTVAHCLQIIEAVPVLQALEKHAKTEMLARLMRGETIPGWRIGRSIGNRKWDDEEAVIAELKASKVPKRVFMREELLSVAQLEKCKEPKVLNVASKHVVREDKGPVVCEERSKLPPWEPVDVNNVFDEHV